MFTNFHHSFLKTIYPILKVLYCLRSTIINMSNSIDQVMLYTIQEHSINKGNQD